MRTAHSVATIREEIRLYPRRDDRTVRDGMVDAIDGVRAELGCQRTLCGSRPRKHHYAASILVEPVNHAELRIDTRGTDPPEQRSGVVGDRLLVPGLIGDAEHPGRLVDNDEVAVVKHDCTLGERAGAELGRRLIDGNHCTRRHTRRGVEAPLAIEGDAPLGTQPTRTRPREPRLLANNRRDGGLG